MLEEHRWAAPQIRSYSYEPWTEHRRPAIHRFGFAILTDEAIDVLRKFGPFIEVGAGAGYWAHEMRAAGLDIIATDAAGMDLSNPYGFESAWTNIIKMDATEAAATHPDRTLLLVWPCYANPWAAEALRAYQGDRVVYCGEGSGGCTADDTFHDMIEAEWVEIASICIPQWDCIHDSIRIYERKDKGDRPESNPEM